MPANTTNPSRGRKRNFVDLTNDDEDENEPPICNKRGKRKADVDDEETIVVARAPLREPRKAQSSSKSFVELDNEQYARKVAKALYIKPAKLGPGELAQYSRHDTLTSATKTTASARKQPAATANRRHDAKTSKASTFQSSASTSKRKSNATKAGTNASGCGDIAKMFSCKSSTSESSTRSCQPEVFDNDDQDDGFAAEGTPSTNFGSSSTMEEGQSSNRASRRGARISYANMDLAESDDELASGHSVGRHGKAAKKISKYQSDDDDDFMAEDDQADVASDFADEAELALDLDESSSDVDVDVEESDDEDEEIKAPRAKAAKRSQAQAKSDDGQPRTKSKKSRSRMVNLKSGKDDERKINHALAPLHDIGDIFHDITSKARTFGLDKAVKHLNARPIRVATMCSGTESPLLALEMIGDCLSRCDLGMNLEMEHLFSAEIVPYKQAYIERNFNPPVIFRDITELTSVVDDDEPMATTAYGGKALVPKLVDMVIAGTSCVDFSGLNSHQKDLDDGGESADTWNAVLSYCRAFRPAIVLLENVSGADWDRMLSDYENIDYECSGAMVNSRDYYLPQVRERGYMACFNKESSGYRPGSAEKWVKLMERFKRPASSPVSDFLIPNDQIIQKLIRNDEPTREVDWRQCEITQMEYRQDMRLGWARPVTHWSESGWKLPPDNGHAAWYHKQVDRVLDTIDGAVLRKALHMYDCRFKTRIFDLSQNIYREKDHRPFGISGCITPSGIYFVTDLGRVLTSEETLKLQGLPLEKISFTTEQQSEIQSLAGNAMSSTVIAASILSSLIPGYRSIDTEHREALCRASQQQNRRLVSVPSERVRAPISNKTFDLDSLLQRAEMASRRCFCEGPTGLAERPIQTCKDCGHTTCTSCGGNPEHDYHQSHATKQSRTSPVEFMDYVHSVMPLRLDFSSVKLHYFDQVWPSEKFGKAATVALRDSFAFSQVRRTHCWTVTYKSEHQDAILELVITPANVFSPTHAEWRLYAQPSGELSGNDPLRRMLEQPIVRSGLLDRSNAPNASAWSLRVPKAKPEARPLTITGAGPKVASWWSRMEMPDFTKHTVSGFLSIKVDDSSDIAAAINGKYQYLPRCGKACNSLYKKTGNGEPMFLFLDPTRTGEPDADCFVFSQNLNLLERDEVRPILARIASSWRPWATNGTSGVAIETKTRLLVDETWHGLQDCALAASQIELNITRCLEPSALATSAKCSELAVLLSCSVPASVASGDKEQIIGPDHAQFFNDHAWAFEAMRRHLPGSDWHEFDESHHAADRCESCAPTRPALRWGLSEDGKDLRPYEDPQGAAIYERAMKSRVDAIGVVTSPSKDGTTFKLGLSIATLAHRAGARLPKHLAPTYTWRFVTEAQDEFKFKPFKLHDTRGLSPYNGKKLGMSVDLFPQQLMALTWMKQQESGVPFVLEEGEEAIIKSLGWRAEVRATATKTIEGGICADHPGFGKTITSLALIHSEFSDSPNMRAELESRSQGLLVHAGTMIVCPAPLIEQWKEEIIEKIYYRSTDLCVVRTVADLSKYTVSQFQNFKIVVVSRALLSSNENYIERLAAFAGMPGPATTKGRSFAEWLNFANQQIPAHLEVRKKGKTELKQHVEAVYQARVTSEDFKASVPSKRLTGADYIAGKEKKVFLKTKAKAQTRVNTAYLDHPLLEMFFWNRIIVDEFHQPEAKLPNIVVASMQADKRWGLSATPAIGDFYEVARMAELIGVPLRIGSDGAGIMKNASVKELRKDMTSFELFDAMRQTPSDSMHARIHEIDQQFLDTFVRQNIMDHDELPFQEHLVPVALDLDHRAMYAELSQHLNSADMRIKKKNSRATDRDKRFAEAVSSSTSAEEALSKVAAFSNRKAGGNTDSHDDVLSLNAVVRNRQAAVDAILRKLPIALSEAKGTEDAFAKWVKSRLEEGTLGDDDTCEQILKLAKAAKGVKVSADVLKKRGKAGGDYGIGKRAFTAYSNGLCNRLLVEKRSARYMQILHKLQLASSSHRTESICDSSGCDSAASQDVAISALCGHAVCRKCYTQKRKREITRCIGRGCSSPMQDHHLFWPHKAGDLSTATPYGAKINAALELLRQIQDKGEQAILFVQYANQLDEVEMALKECGITATVVKSVEKADLQIKAFREGSSKTVIVLNSSDETAAGSNLQNANHVIFLSPLLKDTQYGYDSTTAQTIGRVRRHGQQKEIHIYRIVALDTVDVDVLEHRERRSDALVEQGAPKIARPSTLANKPSVSERTQLVRENDKFSLRPHSWLVKQQDQVDAEIAEEEDEGAQRVKGKYRVLGWEDFSSLVKFSKNFTEDDE